MGVVEEAGVSERLATMDRLLFCKDQLENENGRAQLSMEGTLAVLMVNSILVMSLAAAGGNQALAVLAALIFINAVFGFYAAFTVRATPLVLFPAVMFVLLLLNFLAFLVLSIYMASDISVKGSDYDDSKEGVRITTLVFTAFNLILGGGSLVLSLFLYLKNRPDMPEASDL